MKFDISTVISVLAILVMFYCLWLVLSLRKNVPGGVVGSTWKTLTALVILFTLGYLVTPFFGMLPPILGGREPAPLLLQQQHPDAPEQHGEHGRRVEAVLDGDR